MRVLRWIVSVPAAVGLSFATYFVALSFASSVSYGPEVVHKLGLLPLVFRTALPAIVFVVAGFAISPSKKKSTVFLFFSSSLLFSGGGFDLISASQSPDVVLWLTGASGMIVGSLGGLAIALRVQRRRKEKAEQGARANAATGGSSVVSPASETHW